MTSDWPQQKMPIRNANTETALEEVMPNPMQKILTRCWQDEEFKKSLMANPRAILEAEGVDVPEGITIKVVEDTLQVCHFVIPCKVQWLADGELNWLSGGVVRMPIPNTRHGSC